MRHDRLGRRVAIVTGGARGLGHAYAALLARLGARVVLHDVGADRDGMGQDPSPAAEAARRLREEGREVIPAHDPIDTPEGCRALVGVALDRFGRVDSLLHNAGFVGYRRLAALDPPFLARMMALSVDSSLWLAQAAWPDMAARGFGRIVFTTSDRALFPVHAQAGLAAYAAAKMAAVGIVHALAAEGAADGILVNAISPVARTRMWGVEGEPADLRPDAVAPGAVFLASDRCRATATVLRASNGQFRTLSLREADGVDYPRDLRGVAAGTVDELAGQWDRLAAP